MALGAQQGQVLLLVQRQGMLLVLAGLAIGIVGGMALTQLMTTLLFHVSPRDPWTMLSGRRRTHPGLAAGLLSARATRRPGRPSSGAAL